MKFEWDDNKNRLNLEKHEISFEFAAKVFLDFDRIETIDNRRNYREIRYQTIGMIDDFIVYVVYTERDQNYRIISARKANRDERNTYIQFKEFTS